jgi:hypothetical protein
LKEAKSVKLKAKSLIPILYKGEGDMMPKYFEFTGNGYY